MIDLFQIDTGSSLLLPFADEGIRAGFPSPAQDYMDIAIDLNHELITHPYSTFYGRVKGNSMEDAHVFDGDGGNTACDKTCVVAVCERKRKPSP